VIGPAVRSPGGHLHGRAFGEDALDAADPPFAREAHAGLQEVGAIERDHHVALAAPLPQALLEEDVGPAAAEPYPMRMSAPRTSAIRRFTGSADSGNVTRLSRGVEQVAGADARGCAGDRGPSPRLGGSASSVNCRRVLARPEVLPAALPGEGAVPRGVLLGRGGCWPPPLYGPVIALACPPPLGADGSPCGRDCDRAPP
jgi:hypothetical protein